MGKSSGNEGATLTALKHQTDQQEALGFNVCQRGFFAFGLGIITKKREQPNALPRFCISSLFGFTSLPWKLTLQLELFHIPLH